ncbi:sensor histidine kinase [Lysobacter gummosus]|jgi:signal transduction histidine kinase|uniref:sensor histidine kinase n=1 Tax=Lysobacter gummosus TaxID=262324 RepID=UPI0036304DA4
MEGRVVRSSLPDVVRFTSRTLKRVPNIFWIVLIWWLAYALIFTVQIVHISGPEGMTMSWRQALHFSFGTWMTWVPLSLALYWMVRHFPIERGRFFRSLAALFAASLLVVLLRSVYVYATTSVFNWYGYRPPPGFIGVVATSFNNNFMSAWVVIGLAHALVFYQRSRERGQQVAQLQAGLATAKLQALRAQLNPHFLFNALNSVAEMVHQDAELADRMLVSLSALLREGLFSEREQFRPLHEEISLIKHYLMIEKIRLHERLQLEWRIDTSCLDIPVPALILQPLVENAIVHGIARRRSQGALRIGAEQRGSVLVLEVENCMAPAVSTVRGTGVGLRSISSRLQLLYGGRAALNQCITEAGRYFVCLSIPTSPHVATDGLAGQRDMP